MGLPHHAGIIGSSIPAVPGRAKKKTDTRAATGFLLTAVSTMVTVTETATVILLLTKGWRTSDCRGRALATVRTGEGRLSYRRHRRRHGLVVAGFEALTLVTMTTLVTLTMVMIHSLTCTRRMMMMR